MKPRKLVFLVCKYKDSEALNKRIMESLQINYPFGLYYGPSIKVAPTHAFAFIDYSEKLESWVADMAESIIHSENYEGAYDLAPFCKINGLVRIPVVRG